MTAAEDLPSGRLARVLRRAWSIRFAAWRCLTAAEVVVPLFGDVLPRGAFVLLAFAASIGATVARIVAQPEMQPMIRPPQRKRWRG